MTTKRQLSVELSKEVAKFLANGGGITKLDIKPPELRS